MRTLTAILALTTLFAYAAPVAADTVDLTPADGTLKTQEHVYWSVRAYRVTALRDMQVVALEYQIAPPNGQYVSARIYDSSEALVASGTNAVSDGSSQWYRSEVSYSLQQNQTYTLGFFHSDTQNGSFHRKENPTQPFTVSNWFSDVQSLSTVSETVDQYPGSTNSWAPFIRVITGGDPDNDGFAGMDDNCPFVANPNQTDTDGDGFGDACDPVDDLDLDGDGVANDQDNCPLTANATQPDSDGDGIGDECDDVNNSDIDGDGALNDADNCPTITNADQADSDGDGTGDECDDTDNADIDGDGVANADDNCPLDDNADQADTDGDGFGDVCDMSDGADIDGDGVANDTDNCPAVDNADQADADGDGFGDACDSNDNGDIDGDGVANSDDNCPVDANADQADGDGDGFGDACDTTDNSGDGGNSGQTVDAGGCTTTTRPANSRGALAFLVLALGFFGLRRRR